MKILNKFVDTCKWRRKYNSLCTRYEALADERIQKLEKENEILNKNVEYRNEIDKLKEELTQYKRKFGRLEGGDKNDKNKSKR